MKDIVLLADLDPGDTARLACFRPETFDMNDRFFLALVPPNMGLDELSYSALERLWAGIDFQMWE